MNENLIQCPNCKAEIPVSELLRSQIREQLETTLRTQYQHQLEKAIEAARVHTREGIDLELRDLRQQIDEKAEKVSEAEARELALRKQTRTLQEEREKLEQRLREQFQQDAQAQLETAIAETRDQMRNELEQVQRQLSEQRQKTEQAQQAELALRREKTQLEQRSRELDLEVARRLDEQRQQIEQALRQSIAQEQDLKLKEKEKQIVDLRKALDDAKRRSELGSQELQGEVLELDIQARLERLFPHDAIEPVAKGIRGADIVQTVRNTLNQPCGAIVWESKNTKNWSQGWIDKLKADQRAIGVGIAVLVSVALPEDIESFGQIDGVWVAAPRAWPALAGVLREQLIQVAFAHAASEGKQEKMDLLYRYLAGDQFRHKVQGIVEAFTALQEQLNRERRAMERQWKEREKQIERVITNTVGMYGEMSGILGGTLPSIPALELDGDRLLEDHG
jgi:hypothetical protein